MLTPERKQFLKDEFRDMEKQHQRRYDATWSEWVEEFQNEYRLSDAEMEEVER